MSVFMSYCRLDEDAVKALTRGLETAGLDAWRDHELHGGDNWWSVILEKIRSCSVFLFALSDASLRSKPCRAELDYAKALCRPIVPVQVGPVSNMRLIPLADLQVVGYRQDDATSGFAVLSAIHQAATRSAPLPQPPPPPPPIPYAYLLALSKKIDIGDLAPDEQARIIDDLRRALLDEQEEAVRADIVRMLTEMRRKPWTVVTADREIEKVLSSHGVTLVGMEPVDAEPIRHSHDREHQETSDPARTLSEPGQPRRHDSPPPGWYPDPAGRHEWRWFDHDWTEWASDRGAVVEDPL